MKHDQYDTLEWHCSNFLYFGQLDDLQWPTMIICRDILENVKFLHVLYSFAYNDTL